MTKKLIKEFIEETTYFGSLPFMLFLNLFFLIIGEIKLTLWLFFAMIFSFIIIAIIRLFYYKDRPKKENYTNLLEKISSSSFPSLHSWRITMITILISYYYSSTILMIFFLIISLFVYYSRHLLKKHFLSDIIFGAIFGIIESAVIIRFV